MYMIPVEDIERVIDELDSKITALKESRHIYLEAGQERYWEGYWRGSIDAYEWAAGSLFGMIREREKNSRKRKGKEERRS